MRVLKLAALAIVATGLLGGTAAVTSPAKAQGVSVDIGGPGIRYRDHDDDWRWRHRRWRAEAYGPECRTIVRANGVAIVRS